MIDILLELPSNIDWASWGNNEKMQSYLIIVGRSIWNAFCYLYLQDFEYLLIYVYLK